MSNSPPQFSLPDALRCARASQAAYSQPATIASETAHCLILDSGEATIVAFRGTANARDVLTDIRAVRVNHVHKGFGEALDSIATQLIERLHDQPETKPVFFTGHSLGGALAVLSAWLLHHHFPNAQTYSFGQPRVGDSCFASMCQHYFGDRHWRFVNQEDIVPRLPLAFSIIGRPAGYRHSGQEVFFPSWGGMRVGASIGLKLLSDVWGTWTDWRDHHAIAQVYFHPIARYVEAIESA